MSYFKELPQSEIDAMSRKDMDEYYNKRELNNIRDKFAMAALTGLASTYLAAVQVGKIWDAQEALEWCFEQADAALEERAK